MAVKITFLSSGSGSGGGGTDTNLGNSNLTADNTTRTYKVASSGTLTLQSNGGTNALQVNDSANVLIGGASPYTMPNARGTADEILGLTNGTGTAAWRTMTNNMRAYSETRAGMGLRAESSIVGRQVFVPSPTNTLIDIGQNTITGLSNTVINTLCSPFRQTDASGNGGVGVGSDLVMVKIQAGAPDSYGIVLVASTMATGTPIAIAPTTITTLGTITVARASQWACGVFDLSDVGASLAECNCAWFGVYADTGSEEAVDLQVIFNYANPKSVVSSFS